MSNSNDTKISHFYIITTPDHQRQYKIGHHTGNWNKLCNRYRTSLPKFYVIMFVECDGGRVESNVIEYLKSTRAKFIKNMKGNRSEWVEIDQIELIEIVCSFLNVINDKKTSESSVITKDNTNDLNDQVDSKCDINGRPSKSLNIIDEISSFLDIFVVFDKKSSTKAKDLYELYLDSLEYNEDDELARDEFDELVLNRPEVDKVRKGNAYYYNGIKMDLGLGRR